MIRNTMLGLSLFAFTAGSAFAAAPAATHHTTRTVAQAPAGDTAAPTEKPAKKEKKAKKADKTDKAAPAEKTEKAAKDAPAKTEGAKKDTKEMKAPETK